MARDREGDHAGRLVDDVIGAEKAAPSVLSPDGAGHPIFIVSSTEGRGCFAIATLLLGYSNRSERCDYDPVRDYQSGETRASAGQQGGREQGVELAAVLATEDAKSLVHQLVARGWRKRDKLTLRLPPALLDLEPGQEIEGSFDPAKWTVETCTVDAFVVVAELTRQ